jgi:hypothetical protein
MSRNSRNLIAQFVSEAVEPFAEPFVKPAFNGDIEAAELLAHKLDNYQRGEVAVYMWETKVERPAFREFLRLVWEHDHAHLVKAAKTRLRLAAMFRYADFPIPVHLPETIRVWRGTYEITLNEAVKGYSWTIDRDVACWFAMRFGKLYPQVIAADIPTRQIAYFTDKRGEKEVVLTKRPTLAFVDGNIDDWRVGFERCDANKKDSNAQFLHSESMLRSQF